MRKYQKNKHFKMRLFERYGISISNHDIDTIIRAIKHQHYISYQKIKKNRSLVIYDYKTYRLPLIYCVKSQSIITVLPIDTHYLYY